MNILIASESLLYGGKERLLVELIKGLQKCPDVNCELVLTKKEIHYEDIFSTGVKIHFMVRENIKKDPSLFFKFYKIAKNYDPNVIHVWGNMVAIYAIPSKVLLNIPMINNQITDAPEEVKMGLLGPTLTFPFSDMIVSNSKVGLKSYHAPQDKSSVIYNGFDFRRIENLDKPEIVRAKYKLNTPYTVAMVASFSDKKDYKTYLHAALSILEKRKDITFLCIGKGDAGRYKKMVPELHKENIRFLGRVAKVEPIMNVCDIGILATYTEGISNSIMEFMALGKPVVATDGGGTNELIIDGKTGFLIPQKSCEKLEEKIIFLINNPENKEEMGKMGELRVRNLFGIDKMVKEFISTYHQILKK